MLFILVRLQAAMLRIVLFSLGDERMTFQTGQDYFHVTPTMTMAIVLCYNVLQLTEKHYITYDIPMQVNSSFYICLCMCSKIILCSTFSKYVCCMSHCWHFTRDHNNLYPLDLFLISTEVRRSSHTYVLHIFSTVVIEKCKLNWFAV